QLPSFPTRRSSDLPRTNQLTQSLGELRLLSQTISRQATEATASGTKESIQKLTQSQQSFKDNLETVKDIGSNSAELQKVEADWAKVSQNIDAISSQQAIISKLY